MGVLDYTSKIINEKEQSLTEKEKIIETLSILEHGFESPVLRGKGYSVNEAVSVVNNRIKLRNLVKDDLTFIKDGNKEAGVSAEFARKFANSRKKIVRNLLLTVPLILISAGSFYVVFSDISNAANTNHTASSSLAAFSVGLFSTMLMSPILEYTKTLTRKYVFGAWSSFRHNESRNMMEMITLDQKINNMSFDQLYAESHNLEYSESELSEKSETDENLDAMKITHEEIMSLKEIFDQPKLTEAEIYVIEQSGIKRKKK